MLVIDTITISSSLHNAFVHFQQGDFFLVESNFDLWFQSGFCDDSYLETKYDYSAEFFIMNEVPHFDCKLMEYLVCDNVVEPGYNSFEEGCHRINELSCSSIRQYNYVEDLIPDIAKLDTLFIL